MNNPMIELSQRLHRINNDLKKMREKDDNNKKEIERLGEESLMVMMAITECYEILLSVAPASVDAAFTPIPPESFVTFVQIA